MFFLIFSIILFLVWKCPTPRVLFCDPTGGIATMAVMAIGGGMQAYGQMEQGKQQNQYYQYLAGQSRMEGAAAVARADAQNRILNESGAIEGKNLAEKAAVTSSAQKAEMAASGVSGVTAQDITLDTARKVSNDEMMLRRNYGLQSNSVLDEGKYANWQANEQAGLYGWSGKQAKRAGNIGAFTTLLGTAASMALGASQLGMLSKPGEVAATTGTNGAVGGGLFGGKGGTFAKAQTTKVRGWGSTS
jgi:hypothetical protein